MYLTKQQTLDIIQKSPPGTNPKKILQGLVQRGYQIEGLNTNPTPTISKSTTPSQFKGPVAKTGNALKNFGVGLLKGTGQLLNNVAGPATDAVSKFFGAKTNDQGQTAGTQLAQQNFTPSNRGERIGATVAKTLPAVGIGLATAGAGAELGLGVLGSAALQGTVQGAEGFATTEGGFKTRAQEGLTQGASAAVLDVALPYLFKLHGSSSKAVKTAFDTMDQASEHYSKIGANLVKGAEELTVAHPEAIVKLPIAMAQNLQELGVDVSPYLKNGLTPATVQALSSRVNQIAAMSSEQTATKLFGFNRAFRAFATDALNSTSKGTGTALEGLYDTAQTQYEAMKTVDDIFRPVKTPSASDAEKLLKTVQRLKKTATGRQALQTTVENFKNVSGIDLAKSVQTMSTGNPAPALKKAIKLILEFTTGFQIAKHLPF